MKDTKKVVAMVVDNSGGYVSLAIRLAREYKKIYYCNPAWQHSYPHPNLSSVGQGIPEIEVVDNLFDVYEEIDFWIFPDVYFGPFQEFLREQGEIVWGSGYLEALELERDVLKSQLERLGLPVNKWWRIEGMSALRKFLQKQKDVWVKVNKWRGLVESFYVMDYDHANPILDDMEFRKGIDPEKIIFTVETPINDALEIGYDGFCVDGKFPEAWLSGIERKDRGYFGEWKKYNDLSPLLTVFNEKMANIYKTNKYRGFLSLESRLQGEKAFLIDFTARCPNPPGAIYLEMIKNLGAVMWAGGNGEVIPAEPVARYGAEIGFDSEWCIEHICPVYIPQAIVPFVKLKKHRRENGIDLIVPVINTENDAGSIIGLGDTPEKAIKQAKDNAAKVMIIKPQMEPDALDKAYADYQKFTKGGK